MLLIDIRNAFSSLPYEAIFEAYKSYGVGNKFLNIIKDIHTDNFTELLTAAGISELTPIILGIKQGCPASGPTYNVAVNPLYPLVLALHENLHILGYADDTVVIEDNPEALHNAYWIKLSNLQENLGFINPHKCKSVYIAPAGIGLVMCQPTVFRIADSEIEHLAEFKATKYLGKTVGFKILDDVFKIDR